ncbi:hypothetical protein V2A89_02245 [Pseudomonas aeruginosa]
MTISNMIDSIYIENLKSQRGNLLLEIEDKEKKVSELEPAKEEVIAKIHASRNSDGRRTQATVTLERELQVLEDRYKNVKDGLGSARASLRNIERSLFAESQVQKHRETFLSSESQLAAAKTQQYRVGTVCSELTAEINRDEASLQGELTQHAAHQLEARLAGDAESALPQAITDLQASISGKRATLAAAEMRKQQWAEQVNALQDAIVKAKKNWQDARFALAELEHHVAIESIKPALVTLLAAMRESGNGFNTTITVTIDVDDIEAARVNLKKELLRDN